MNRLYLATIHNAVVGTEGRELPYRFPVGPTCVRIADVRAKEVSHSRPSVRLYQKIDRGAGSMVDVMALLQTL